MGNFFTAFSSFLFSSTGSMDHPEFNYAMFDPGQMVKPSGRTKDIISTKHGDNPNRLDRVKHLGCDTVWKLFKRSVWRDPSKPFLGVRQKTSQHFMGIASPGQRPDQLGDYQWKTWQDIDDYVEAASRVFIKKNLCPLIESDVEGTPDLKFLGIFSENRPEWVISELAATGDSVCVVPIAVQQQFLSEDRVCSVLNKTELTTVCVSKQTIGVLLDLKAKEKIPKVKNVVMFDQSDEIHLTLATQVGLELFSFSDVINEGMKLMDVPKEEPTADSIFYIGITSGTTDEPKMAMLTHLNFISGQVCEDFLGFNYTSEEVYLSYVPLTHVYEQIMLIDSLMFGFRIGFSSGDIQNLLSDIQCLRPTIFGSFPAFYSKIHNKILEKIEEQSGIVQTIIDSAIQSKIKHYLKTGSLASPIFDWLIFSKMRAVMGGRIRWFVSGGAPLNIEVKHTLQVVFGCPIFEAYGMTEAAGCLSCTAYWERGGNHVGGVLPCGKFQLRDVPSLNFSTDSTPPQGELYIKGNSVMKGYFKEPELTAQQIDEDGWMRIGDVATLNPNGSITLMDRVTEFKKLQNGQYISPQKLESIYAEVPLVNQIYIDVNPNYNIIVAVVSIAEDKAKQFAEVNGLHGETSQFLGSQDLEYGVLKQLERAANQRGLDDVERVMRVLVADEPFSVKNGMLTATQKLRRSAIRSRYGQEIENMYTSFSMKNKKGQQLIY